MGALCSLILLLIVGAYAYQKSDVWMQKKDVGGDKRALIYRVIGLDAPLLDVSDAQLKYIHGLVVKFNMKVDWSGIQTKKEASAWIDWAKAHYKC